MYPTNNYNELISAVNNQWPYLEAKDYRSFSSIVEAFPHLKNVNVDRDLTQSNNKIGLIIRSANDDNVHKAIKYGIWTTTPRNKSKLEQLWQKNQKDQTQVYLFFSAVKSGMFEGVARLASDYYQETFPFWWENHSLKFKGFFFIEWIYIKDINYKHLDGLYNIEGQQVTKSKDCDILDVETTTQMLQIYKKRPLKRYIFDDFEKMDDRQKNYTRKMYEYVLYQQNQQQFYGNYNYKPMMTNAQKSNTNPGSFPPQTQSKMMNVPTIPVMQKTPAMSSMMPMPSQMMRPTHMDSNGGNSLGFQMNPVSKNRKK